MSQDSRDYLSGLCLNEVNYASYWPNQYNSLKEITSVLSAKIADPTADLTDDPVAQMMTNDGLDVEVLIHEAEKLSRSWPSQSLFRICKKQKI